MTNTFILFIFGMFEDTEDIEFYCNEILLENPAVKSLRFIVENSKNLIVLIESDKTQKELSSLKRISANKMYNPVIMNAIYRSRVPIHDTVNTNNGALI